MKTLSVAKVECQDGEELMGMEKGVFPSDL